MVVITLVSILEAETDSCLEFEVSLLYIVTSRSAEGFIHVWLCYNESQRTICESQFSFHNVGARMSGLANNCFHPLIHLVSPLMAGLGV